MLTYAGLCAILTAGTALEAAGDGRQVAGGGRTALHLLCQHFAARHKVIEAYLGVQADAARLAADDGSLPLHVLARYAGRAGADESIRHLLGVHFTCFTGTKVHILTRLKAVVGVFPPATVATDDDVC